LSVASRHPVIGSNSGAVFRPLHGFFGPTSPPPPPPPPRVVPPHVRDPFFPLFVRFFPRPGGRSGLFDLSGRPASSVPYFSLTSLRPRLPGQAGRYASFLRKLPMAYPRFCGVLLTFPSHFKSFARGVLCPPLWHAPFVAFSKPSTFVPSLLWCGWCPFFFHPERADFLAYGAPRLLPAAVSDVFLSRFLFLFGRTWDHPLYQPVCPPNRLDSSRPYNCDFFVFLRVC